jgi:hypothetical protein
MLQENEREALLKWMLAEAELPREDRLSIYDESPSHSFRRDRQAEIGFRQGNSSAEISKPSAFRISLRSL